MYTFLILFYTILTKLHRVFNILFFFGSCGVDRTPDVGGYKGLQAQFRKMFNALKIFFKVVNMNNIFELITTRIYCVQNLIEIGAELTEFFHFFWGGGSAGFDVEKLPFPPSSCYVGAIHRFQLSSKSKLNLFLAGGVLNSFALFETQDRGHHTDDAPRTTVFRTQRLAFSTKKATDNTILQLKYMPMQSDLFLKLYLTRVTPCDPSELGGRSRGSITHFSCILRHISKKATGIEIDEEHKNVG